MPEQLPFFCIDNGFNNVHCVEICSQWYYNDTECTTQQTDFVDENVNKHRHRDLCNIKRKAGDLVKTNGADRRVKYTKMVLKKSLLELMGNRPIAKVTIKEICDLADVNRGTFYKHYGDQYDLLNEIQNDLDSEIKATLEKRLTNSSSSADIILETIRCIAAQSSLCEILCGEYGDGEFLKKLMYNAHDQFIEEWKVKLKNDNIKQLDRFYTYTANGIIAIVLEWLQEGMKESPEEIAYFIENATNYGLSSFVDSIN